MKDSAKLKSRQASIRSDLVLYIKEHIKRIQDLLRAETPDNATDGEIRLPEPVFIKEIDDQLSQHIHSVFTSGESVSMDIDGVEEITISINDCSDDVLINVLSQLEEIKTVADVELIG